MNIVLTGFLVAVATVIFHRLFNYYMRYKQIQAFGVPSDNHWLLGQLPTFGGPTEEGRAWSYELMKTFKTCCSFRIGPRHTLRVHHPSTVKAILKTTEPKALANSYGYLLPWLGDGLLLSSGKKWARNRRLLTPAFHFDILKPYLETFNKSSEKLCASLRESCRGGRSVEIFSAVSTMTLDVILQCAFSKSEENLPKRSDNQSFLEAVNTAAELFINRILTPIQHFDAIFWNIKAGREFKKRCDYLHSVAESVIHERRQDLEKETQSTNSNRLLDFLDILLSARDENGNGLTDLEIRDEADTFLFEGHDTTASAISWILKEMAFNKKHADLCRDEIRELLRGRKTQDLTWDDMNRMPYTTQCIKESMRLNTPVPSIARCITNDLEIDGKILPKGTGVDIELGLMHINPHVWGDDVLEFKPERFHPENVSEMDSFAFCPFSAGPRNCIGQNFAMNEIKLTVAKILMTFELAPVEERMPRRLAHMVLRAENGLHLKLNPFKS